MRKDVTELAISTGACAVGFLLDYIFGDPVWLYHPVRIIGNGITAGERILRRLCGNKQEKETHSRMLVFAGAMLWIFIAALSFLIPAGLLFLARSIHPLLAFVIESFWCYQIVAARCLCKESGNVYEKLKKDDLSGARKAVSMIVGRDTENLTKEGVIKAAVETVAENTSDGVTAPLIYMLIGGAPLGFLYKAVNTMDSMLGYKNDRYLYFGRIPARMDDIFNYIPARVTSLVMIAAAWVCGMDGRSAWKIWRRDGRKHASPNSAQTESVCAGALHIRLAGDAYYFGKLHKKEFIGDDIRPVEPDDIGRAGRLMYMTSFLILIAGIIIKCAALFFLF